MTAPMVFLLFGAGASVGVLLTLMWIAKYGPSTVSCATCGKAMHQCGNCSIAFRFRFVKTPPDTIRWSADGGPHPENDCGGCAKYVRVDGKEMSG